MRLHSKGKLLHFHVRLTFTIDRFERYENYLKLTIRIDMEYIPAFEESVPMLLVEGNHIALLMDEIKGELL